MIKYLPSSVTVFRQGSTHPAIPPSREDLRLAQPQPQPHCRAEASPGLVPGTMSLGRTMPQVRLTQECLTRPYALCSGGFTLISQAFGRILGDMSYKSSFANMSTKQCQHSQGSAVWIRIITANIKIECNRIETALMLG